MALMFAGLDEAIPSIRLIHWYLWCTKTQMIEGYEPFYSKQDEEAAKSFAEKERPPFRAPTKFYAHGLKQ